MRAAILKSKKLIMTFIVIATYCSATLSALSARAAEIDNTAIVAAHNTWRAAVGVTEKLTYSPALAVQAQTWADHLKHSNHCQMVHSEADGQYGENLYWASALAWSDGRRELQDVSPEKVVDSWGSEKADYDYANNRCVSGKKCGHYTQMVWRTTTAVGCARAVCEDTHEQVWVCQYQPAGNWVGRQPY
jgi:pathogenesis-related protein 1